MAAQRNIIEIRSPEDKTKSIYSRPIDSHVPFNVGDEVSLIAEFKHYKSPVLVSKVEWRIWDEAGSINVKCVVYCE
jgi:hypothetical protein